MPAYKDLEIIKEKIKNIGNEPALLKENDEEYNNTPIPEEIIKSQDNIIEDERAEVDGLEENEIFNTDEPVDDLVDGLIDEIVDDFDGVEEIGETAELSDVESQVDEISELDDNDSISSPGTFDLDSLLENAESKIDSGPGENEEEVPEVDLDSLLGDMSGQLTEDINDDIIEEEGETIGAGIDSGDSEEDFIGLTDESDNEAEDFESLLGDIGEGEESHDLEENSDLSDLDNLFQSENEPEIEEDIQGNESQDEDLDSLLQDLGSDLQENESQANEDNLDSLLGDMGQVTDSIPDILETDNEPDIDENGAGDLDALLSDAADGEGFNIDEADIEETTGNEDIIQEEDEFQGDSFGDLDSLLADDFEETLEGTSEDTDEVVDDLQEEGFDEIETGDALSDLAGEFSNESVSDISALNDTSEIVNEVVSDDGLNNLDNLDSLLQDNEETKAVTEDNELSDLLDTDHLDDSGIIEDSSEDFIPEPGIEGTGEFDDFSETDEYEDSGLGSLEDLTSFDELDLSNEGQEDLNLGAENESDDFNGFDLESIESLSDGDIESPPDTETLDINSIDASEESDFMDSSFGKIPEELSPEDVSKDHDIELNLKDNERKQIIISLTSLPKEAELKIAKAIVSNKYSNQQLKPLIDLLIENEAPNIIIKYYEKITGDKSLSHISSIKFTGQDFEERQKSFSYLFQKNILPIISIIGIVFLVFSGLLILYFTVIQPSITAGRYYTMGLKSIKNNEYWNSEVYFEKAYNTQPRFNKVLEYAETYEAHKRYQQAEKKYELAINMNKDNMKANLKYANFFRKKRDYERAEEFYKTLLINDDKNVQVMLGLAKTYMDWSEEINSKYEDAEQVYFDILELDPGNKEATYGKLGIFLRQKNHKEIMNHYKYIDRKFGNNIDPKVYADLANYLINQKQLDEVKNILDKATKSLKKNQIYPEVEFQNSRYKKYLNIFNEERNHLENTLKVFEIMRNTDEPRYNSKEYQNLLAKVYNNLGENYDRVNRPDIDAEKYYRKAIQTDPDYGKPYYNLANYAFYFKSDNEGYMVAKQNYLEAERKGFTNDTLNYNLGRLYYKENDYMSSFQRLSILLDKYPYNSNLKFITGTIYYKLGNYSLAESWLLDSYIHFSDLIEKNEPLDYEVKEHKMIMDMMQKTSNNLGAAYQKKYEEVRNTRDLILANKYYTDSMLMFDKIMVQTGRDSETLKDKPHINLRMTLYPYESVESPFIYEDFPNDFQTTM